MISAKPFSMGKAICHHTHRIILSNVQYGLSNCIIPGWDDFFITVDAHPHSRWFFVSFAPYSVAKLDRLKLLIKTPRITGSFLSGWKPHYLPGLKPLDKKHANRTTLSGSPSTEGLIFCTFLP